MASHSTARLDHLERQARDAERALASRNEFWDAVYWCETFLPRSRCHLAASSALMLRSMRGKGAVTREMVLERCELAWPSVDWPDSVNTNERSAAA
jgi:hypothetical protein